MKPICESNQANTVLAAQQNYFLQRALKCDAMTEQERMLYDTAPCSDVFSKDVVEDIVRNPSTELSWLPESLG